MNLSDIVLSVPHCSTFIPDDVRARIPHADDVLAHEPDLYTDQIYALPDVRTVTASVSRVISDVNRAPDEIYTAGPERARGVVMLSFSNGIDLYEEEPSLREMQRWVDAYHQPFHTELDQALSAAKFLIDGHSMWSVAPASSREPGRMRPDVVIGNRLFTTCDAATTKFFRDAFRRHGMTVAVNDPFIGRYIVGTHCSRKHVPGLQIELKRSLYMDEQSLEPFPKEIDRLRGVLQEIVEEFCAWDARAHREEELCDLSVN